MSQHDYSIPDQDGASFLVDLNKALGALASVNKGSTAPATPYDGQVWCDDGGAPWIYKVYSGADQGWRPFLKLDAASGTVTLVGGVELSSALSIAQGGTSATTADGARTALGFTAPILDKGAPGDIGGTTPGNIEGVDITASGSMTIGSDVIYSYGGVKRGVTFSNQDGVWSRTYSGYAFYWDVGGSPVMTINDAGNVGIGTVSPLNIAGSTNLTVNAPASYGHSYIDLSVDDDVSCRVTATPSRSVDVSAEFITFSTGSWEHGTIAERARIDSSGNLLVGTTAGLSHILAKSVSEGSDILILRNPDGVKPHRFRYATGRSWNAAETAYFVGENSATNRSINAGGTINASGADYAEYETKRDDCGVIAKGDLCGFDADGLLTDVFATAVSFGIKSTDPSYVGGDVWGTEDALGLEQPEQPVRKEAVTEQRDTGEVNETGAPILETVVIEPGETDAEWQVRLDAHDADKAAFDATLEAARQKVDRIAYAGKVPMNVPAGTSFAVGDTVFPVAAEDGGIAPAFVAEPTFEQYRKAVGYVRSVGDDGRPVVAVKVG